MNCNAAIAGAALAAGVYAGSPGASWSETISIPLHVDGGCCSVSAGSSSQADPAPSPKGPDVPVTANEATSDHPELSIVAPSGPGAMALASSAEPGDNAPAAVGSVADPEPSTLTRWLIVFSDLRDRVFGP
jgi:hypothetical protein